MNNECMICGFDMNDEDSFSLKCGSEGTKHRFHTLCLNKCLMSSNPPSKACPYCREPISGYIPCPDGIKPCRGLHIEASVYRINKTDSMSSLKNKVHFKLVRCCSILKTKGVQCSKYVKVPISFDEKTGQAKCGTHNVVIDPKVTIVKVKTINPTKK